MSISATIQDSQQVSMIDVELAQLAQDMRRLHSLGRCVDAVADLDRFASLEHNVDQRLDHLASVFAMQEHDDIPIRHIGQ